MNRKGRFVFPSVLGVLILLLVALFQMTPAKAVSLGTVEVLSTADAAITYANQGSTIRLKITDPDLNVAADTTEAVTYAACAANESRDIIVSNNPIVDRDGNGVVTALDVVAGNASPTVFAVIAANDGLVRLKCGATDTTSTSQNLTYKASALNNTDNGAAKTVKLTSNADPTGIELTLTETGVDTSIFTTNASAGSDVTLQSAVSNAGNRQLQVGLIDVVVIAYTDVTGGSTVVVTKSLAVETTKPEFSNFSPAHDAATTNSLPTVSGDITDSDSGVVKDSLGVVFKVGNAVTEADPDAGVVGTITAITSGFHVTQRNLTVVTDGTISWWITGTDGAGNAVVSDRDSATVCVPGTFAVVAGAAGSVTETGCDPYVVNVDNTAPSLVIGTGKTTTGDWWDTALKTAADGKNDRVRVEFNEDLDGTTVDKTDFTVAGVTPLNAEWFSGSAKNVFLTVGALAADSSPTVAVVGSIADKAGNSLNTGSGTADDGIPATLTVTVTGTNSTVTSGTIKIRVTTNETLTTTPVLEVKKVGNNNALGADVSSALLSVATQTWEREFSVVGGAGRYNVYVTANDSGGLIQTKVGSATDSTVTGAVLFEVDAAVEAPTYRPTGLSSDNPDTFITLDFRNEGKEYGLDSGGTATTTAANVVTDFDTHGTVTITSATLDGNAITFNTRDNIIFSVRPGALAVGAHPMVVAVTDETGNTSTLTLSVTITTPALYAIPLDPGMNLISLPAAPGAGSNGVNDVFSDSSIEAVSTYDPFQAGGPWRTATRNPATGLLEGNLTTVGATTAYWVQSSSFVNLAISIPKAGTLSVPGSIRLSKGWNLVPVIDISRAAFGSVKASYFTSVSPGSVLTWRTDTTTWVKISEGAAAPFSTGEATAGTLDENTDGLDNEVAVGRGYWVHVAAAGNLIN